MQRGYATPPAQEDWLFDSRTRPGAQSKPLGDLFFLFGVLMSLLGFIVTSA